MPQGVDLKGLGKMLKDARKTLDELGKEDIEWQELPLLIQMIDIKQDKILKNQQMIIDMIQGLL